MRKATRREAVVSDCTSSATALSWRSKRILAMRRQASEFLLSRSKELGMKSESGMGDKTIVS